MSVYDATAVSKGGWQEGEKWRVVEQREEGQGWIKLKYLFRDGTSQYVNFRPGTFNAENVALTGEHLLADSDLRVRR